MNKKWIAYGVTGAVGLGLVAGGASAMASAMDLRTTDGTVVPGGAITGKNGSVLDRPVTLSVSDTSVTVVSAATPTVVTPASAATPATAPSPTTSPSPVTPNTPPTPASPASPVTPPSPVSPATPASPVSAASPATPASPASVASSPSN